MKLFTIGFTRTSAERFFDRLKRAGVTRVVDVRLNNVSQLAGFAKRDDLRFLLRAVAGVDYVHAVELAPTQPMLDDYRQGRIDWGEYEAAFRALLAQRRIERVFDKSLLDRTCLLCSEAQPHQCHRRVVAEYLDEHWGDVAVEHL